MKQRVAFAYGTNRGAESRDRVDAGISLGWQQNLVSPFAVRHSIRIQKWFVAENSLFLEQTSLAALVCIGSLCLVLFGVQLAINLFRLPAVRQRA